MNLALALEFLLVCLIAVAYRQSWLAECARADRFRDQTNDYMVENTALRRELAESKNHARYFESLSEWQAEHHRVPTDEERDVLWERIRAKPIENAHTANGGMGRKADANTIVPLCRWHHRQIHRHGVGTFQAAENLDLAKAAARVERDWQKYLAGERAE